VHCNKPFARRQTIRVTVTYPDSDDRPDLENLFADGNMKSILNKEVEHDEEL
jgi:hypothetical protein